MSKNSEKKFKIRDTFISKKIGTEFVNFFSDQTLFYEQTKRTFAKPIPILEGKYLFMKFHEMGIVKWTSFLLQWHH